MTKPILKNLIPTTTNQTTTMNRSIEPDLTSLLPSLAGPIPPELLELTASLVAQSRTRISNLKPQEEIARSYVCAHIACERHLSPPPTPYHLLLTRHHRLKNALDLPTISPHPPLPKRAYDSLLSHFRASLLPTTAPSSPRKRPASEPLAPTIPASSLNPTLRADLTALCTRLNVPLALPHILTGMASILGAPENDRVKGVKTIFAISVAVTILVVERLAPYGGGVKVGGIAWQRGVGYKTKQKEVMEVLGEVAKGRAKGTARQSVDDWKIGRAHV